MLGIISENKWFNKINGVQMLKKIKPIVVTIILSLTALAVSCGGGDSKDQASGGANQVTKEEFLVVQHVSVGDNIDNAMANKGEKIFQEKCGACHKYDTRLVGPPLGEVTKRRSPEFIMSQILDPEKMLANNDTIKALLAKYLTPMANQHLSHEEARAVLEHLRSVAARGGK